MFVYICHAIPDPLDPAFGLKPDSELLGIYSSFAKAKSSLLTYAKEHGWDLNHPGLRQGIRTQRTERGQTIKTTLFTNHDYPELFGMIESYPLDWNTR